MGVSAHRDESFARFYEAEYPRLAGALRLMTGDRAVAEELAQEALYRALRAWGRVREMDRPGAWVVAVGMNLARRHRHLPNISAHKTDAFDDPTAVGGERADLIRVLGGLPVDQRAAVVVRHVLDYPTADAAVILGRSPEATRALLHRAVETLRKELKEQTP